MLSQVVATSCFSTSKLMWKKEIRIKSRCKSSILWFKNGFHFYFYFMSSRFFSIHLFIVETFPSNFTLGVVLSELYQNKSLEWLFSK